MKKTFCIILCICILLSLYGCNRNEEVEMTPLTDVDEYFKVTYKIEPTEKNIPLELARNCYVKSIVDVASAYPSLEQFSECFKYKHRKFSASDSIDYFIFDIEGFETLKYYMYIEKDCMPNKDYTAYVPHLTQTIFVDEKYKNESIEFFVGNTIEKIRENYPDAQETTISTDLDIKVFEILNNDGLLYVYQVDEDGIIFKKNIFELTDDGFFTVN